MIHQLIFARPKPGLSEADFQRYWLEVHAVRYASKIPQFELYMVCPRVDVGPATADPLFGGAAEIWFQDEAAQMASLESREFLDGARVDEPRWAAFWATLVLDTDPHVLLEGPRPVAEPRWVKVYFLQKRKPGMELEAFRSYLLDDHAPRVLELPGLRRYVQGHVRDAAYQVGESRFDAVSQLWFDDTASAWAALRSPHYRRYIESDYDEFLDRKYEFHIAASEHWIIGPDRRVPRQVPRKGLPGTEQSGRVVREFFAAIGRGEESALKTYLSPDIVFELPQDEHNRIIPYLGTKRGLKEVAEAFRIRGETTEVLDYQVRGCVSQDDEACAVIYTKAKCRETGGEFEVEDIHHLRVDDAGRIVRWKVYFDPNTEVAAFRAGIDDRLLSAVRDGDIGRVGRMIEDGADPNARDRDGLTALMVAAGRANDGVALELLNRGADPWVTEPHAGNSVLHLACLGGNAKIVRMLLDRGMPVDTVTPTTGHTPLMDAFWYKWPDIVQVLLDRGAGLGLSTHYGFTLDQHVEFEQKVNVFGKDRFERAKAMLEHRRRDDAAATTSQKLMAAVSRGDLLAAKAHLREGEAVDERFPILNGFNDAHTPLLVACRDGHLEIAAELIKAGADVNAVEPTFGAVPLHKAVYNGHHAITRLLVEQPHINLDYRGATNGYTPLHDALWHGHLESAEALLDAGADTSVRGYDGKRPLEIAIEVFGPDAPVVARLRRDGAPATSAASSAVPSRVQHSPLLFYIQMRWNVEGRLSFDELWDLELKEAEWAVAHGPKAQLWKVAGQKRVVGIVAVDSVEELDRVIMGRLPMREYLEFEAIWPLREYGDFVVDVKRHYRV